MIDTTGDRIKSAPPSIMKSKRMKYPYCIAFWYQPYFLRLNICVMNTYLLSIYDEESGKFFNTISICDIINNNYADLNRLKYDKELKNYVLFVIKNINERIIFFENKIS